MRNLTVLVLLSLLLSACGAAETTAPSATPSATEPSTAAADPPPASAAAATPATSPAGTPAAAGASRSAAAAPTSDAPSAGATIDTDAAPADAAGAVAAASAPDLGGAPAADGCAPEMPQVNPAASTLAAAWNADGTITVRGGLAVPSDAVALLLVHQNALPVGWATFGRDGTIEPGPQIEERSVIPRADAIIYEDILAADALQQNPYQPDAPVCVAVIVVPGETEADPAEGFGSVLALVRLPVAGTAPAEMVVPEERTDAND